MNNKDKESSGTVVKEVLCVCGKKFNAKTSDIKREWGKSCSKSCSARVVNRKTGNFKKYIERQKKKNSFWEY